MSESSEEKTEEPTSRRLQKAREEGQVARSQELPAAAVTIAALAMILITGNMLMSKLSILPGSAVEELCETRICIGSRRLVIG